MQPRSQQAERHRVTIDTANTVAVPLNLAPLAALLVELGAREITQRGGSRSAMQGLPQLEAILRTAVASAHGTPAPTIELRSQPEELTTDQAAELMGISARRVRELARTGRIVSRKVAARDWLIDAGSARSYRRNV
jgi:excisionase family DNA binding protein